MTNKIHLGENDCNTYIGSLANKVVCNRALRSTIPLPLDIAPFWVGKIVNNEWVFVHSGTSYKAAQSIAGEDCILVCKTVEWIKAN